MNYLTYKRFKSKSLSGPDVNIPAFTPCECIDHMIRYNGLDICVDRSFNGTEHFTQNEDGRGEYRGKLLIALRKHLAQPDWHNELNFIGNKPPEKMTDAEREKLNSIMDTRRQEYQAKWDKIWDDPRLQKYKRPEHADMWLWNLDYYNAPVEDLEYICELTGYNIKRIR